MSIKNHVGMNIVAPDSEQARAGLSLKWLKMVFLFFFCLLAFDLGLFCGRILVVLKDGKSWSFNESERK